VDREQVTPDHVLKSNELVTHAIHRHEPPVTGESIEILKQEDGYIGVHKPSSIPVCRTYLLIE
jgi:23S rRNA-/tRNA-specific pseudouridylate synthase